MVVVSLGFLLHPSTGHSIPDLRSLHPSVLRAPDRHPKALADEQFESEMCSARFFHGERAA